MQFTFESVSKPRKKAVYNHLVYGQGKQKAIINAGLSPSRVHDIFNHYKVRAYVQEWKRMESEISEEKKELIAFYRSIINAPVGRTYKQEIEKWKTARQAGDPEVPKKFLEGVDVTYENPITMVVKMAAAKELSILLGLREEKTKISTEGDFIQILNQRRQELANENPLPASESPLD